MRATPNVTNLKNTSVVPVVRFLHSGQANAFLPVVLILHRLDRAEGKGTALALLILLLFSSLLFLGEMSPPKTKAKAGERKAQELLFTLWCLERMLTPAEPAGCFAGHRIICQCLAVISLVFLSLVFHSQF